MSSSADSSVSLQAQLRQMMEGFEKSQLLYVAAKLGIADLLRDGKKDAQALAQEAGIDAPTLYRVMRGLAWCGVVLHETDDSFSLTPLGRYLETATDDSLHERALCIGEIEYPAWGALLHAVQSGEFAFDSVFGMAFYDYLRHQTETGACFDRMMGKGAVPVAQAVAKAYDFSDIKTIVDVGGSNGAMVTTILRAHPHMCGVIFDVPSVIARTVKHLEGSELTHRLQAVGGDFLVDVPAGGDAYIMKWILHNWDDDHCVRLLKNCHRAMGQQGRLLVVEEVMPERVESSTETVSLDLGMLVHLGGRERTATEFRHLLRRGGFNLQRLLPTSSAMSIVEGVPVS